MPKVVRCKFKKIFYHIETILDNYYISENRFVEIKKNETKEIVEIELNKIEKQFFEEEFNPKEWLIINEYLGEVGEQLFIKYLIDKGYKVEQVSKKSSKMGYDIFAEENGNNRYYEIKTNSINISNNEIETAKKIRKDYFLVFIKDGEKGIEAIIIEEPVKNLEIEEIDLNIYDSNMVSLKINNLSVEIALSKLEEFKKIDLSKYCEYKTIKEIIKNRRSVV